MLHYFYVRMWRHAVAAATATAGAATVAAGGSMFLLRVRRTHSNALTMTVT